MSIYIIIYMIGVIFVYAVGCYEHGYEYLQKYRENKLLEFEKIYIHDETSAIVYGISKKFMVLLLMSLIWPVTILHGIIIMNIINNNNNNNNKKLK